MSDTELETLRTQLHTLEAQLRSAQEKLEAADQGTCLLAGPGRGDCEHAVGLQGHRIPNQHDGPDDTVDAYGKPNGWCWMCWRGKKIEMLERSILRARDEGLEKAAKVADMYVQSDATAPRRAAAAGIAKDIRAMKESES